VALALNLAAVPRCQQPFERRRKGLQRRVGLLVMTRHVPLGERPFRRHSKTTRFRVVPRSIAPLKCSHKVLRNVQLPSEDKRAS